VDCAEPAGGWRVSAVERSGRVALRAASDERLGSIARRSKECADIPATMAPHRVASETDPMRRPDPGAL